MVDLTRQPYGMCRRVRAPRNIRVESLRLAAIIGISLFHTMTPWTAQALCETNTCSQAGEALASSPGIVTILGVIALLGSWGNHVFFMISGFYLLPSLARRSTRPRYWSEAAQSTFRRVLAIVVSVVFVALVALVFDRWVMPLVNVRLLWQWTLAIEFVWLYAAFIMMAPIVAWLMRRMTPRARVAVCSVLVIVVMALNVYVAFVAPGDVAARGLTDWRKWMSAITYVIGFVSAGAAGMMPAPRAERLPATRRHWVMLTVVIMLITVAVELWAAIRRDMPLIGQLSYKSTSPLAMALACTLVISCALGAASREDEDLATASCHTGLRRGVIGRVVGWLASGILGFYIVQSVFSVIAMDAGIQRILDATMRWGMIRFGALEVSLLLLAVAMALSVGYVLIVLAIDGWTRRPILRAVGLG